MRPATPPPRGTNDDYEEEEEGARRFTGWGTSGLDDWMGGVDGDVDEDGRRLPPWPSDPPLCSVCPRLSPEGAYDVWLIAEDDGNRLPINASAGGNGTADAGARAREVNRQSVASRAMAFSPLGPGSGPSVVMADDTPPSFTPGYPRVEALNGSALLLEVSLNEPGAVVFALRPDTAAAAALDRAGVQAAAGWTPFSRKYPTLGRGAAAGVLQVSAAGMLASHVVTEMPPINVAPGANRLGTRHAIDFFAIDVEPSRGSSLTPPKVPNARDVTSLIAKMADTLAPLWAGSSPFLTGVGVGAAAVNASAPGGERGGAHLARLFVSGSTDEPSTVFFVVASATPVAGFADTGRPRVTPGEVMNGTTGSAAYPAVAAGYFSTGDAASWQSEGYPLVQGRGYVAWVIAVDTTLGANAQAAAVDVEFNADDRLPPAFAEAASGARAGAGAVLGRPAVTGALLGIFLMGRDG